MDLKKEQIAPKNTLIQNFIQPQQTKLPINDTSLNKSSESWSNSLLSFSSILNKQGLGMLVKWLIKPVSKIVFMFKASSNGFRLPKYFQQCGDLINTIIIVKTKKGKIIGGFTPLSFNPSVNWTSK